MLVGEAAVYIYQIADSSNVYLKSAYKRKLLHQRQPLLY